MINNIRIGMLDLQEYSRKAREVKSLIFKN